MEQYNTSDAINVQPTPLVSQLPLPKTVIINDIHQHNRSHTSKCSIDIFDNELNTYNPYNDRYSYEDEVEYNDGVQKIISKLVKIDTED